MIGEKRVILKTLTRLEVHENERSFNAPLMAHYIIKPNFLVAAHVPLAGINHFEHNHRQTGLGDISVQMKYQFFRWDKSRKTARAALKVQQYFPTGFDSHNYEISIGEWQTLPLVYPPKQINLYFEYDGEINLDNGAHNLFLAQGIQYAIKRITFETAIKIPIIQNDTSHGIQKYTLLFGTRFII